MLGPADILPVYHIGNSQMFSFWGHRGLSRWLRVSVGVFWGRYCLPLPRRHDIISLVGRPIPGGPSVHPVGGLLTYTGGLDRIVQFQPVHPEGNLQMKETC